MPHDALKTNQDFGVDKKASPFILSTLRLSYYKKIFSLFPFHQKDTLNITEFNRKYFSLKFLKSDYVCL